jgi:porin
LRGVLASRALATAAVLATLLPATASVAGAEPVLDHLRETPRLLGDPAGWRSRAERIGISLQLYYHQLWAWKPRGGVERDGVTGHSGSFDLYGRFDLEELAGLHGLVAFLHVKGQYDRHLNETVGAFSDVADDADFDEAVYVDQLWLEQGWLEGRVRLRAGYMELQSVFDRNAYANSEDRQFMNSALDNDPLVPLPGALGAALVVRPWPWLELAVGLADADARPHSVGFESFRDDADSLNGYLEAKLDVRLGDGLRGQYRLGLFRDGRERVVFGRLDRRGRPGTDRGHLGFYLSFDQALWRPSAGEARGVGAFARVARADPDTSPIEWFWSAGLEWSGPAPTRRDDALGVAAYQMIASPEHRRAVPGAFHRETGLELYYRIALLPWLALTPDVQYIVEPGASPRAGDALVAQLRARVAF